MTTTANTAELDRFFPPSPAATPDWTSQGTAIEQARAIAEVQAAIVVAQNRPRDENRAIDTMRRACQRKALAETAFFRYERAGGQITGPSVHLARELARCWGNVTYGLTELRRDDGGGFSEMQAWAWDLESNARNAHVFIVPHVRDRSGGGKNKLTAARDIYENNANMGARRVREAIFAVLPIWFTDEAKEICFQTLEPPPQSGEREKAIGEVIAAFARMRVDQRQLEAKVGRPVQEWVPADVATLKVVGKSIRSGEATVEQEFPTERTTADDLKAAAQPTPEA